MAWHQIDAKPLSKSLSWLTHVCHHWAHNCMYAVDCFDNFVQISCSSVAKVRFDTTIYWWIFDNCYWKMEFLNMCSLLSFWWVKVSVRLWTHSGLVTSYGVQDLGQRWIRQGLSPVRPQVITWSNSDLMYIGKNFNEIQMKVQWLYINKMHLEIGTNFGEVRMKIRCL